MKRLLALFSLCLAVLPALAQETPRPIFYVSGGAALPLSPTVFPDTHAAGYSLGGGVGLLFTGFFILRASVDYAAFGADDEGLSTHLGEPVEADALTLLTLLGEVKANWPSAGHLSPFVTAGAGFASGGVGAVRRAGEALESNNVNELGFALGAGLDVALQPRLALFVEARYVLTNFGIGKDPALTADDADALHHVPLRLGLSFQ